MNMHRCSYLCPCIRGWLLLLVLWFEWWTYSYAIAVLGKSSNYISSFSSDWMSHQSTAHTSDVLRNDCIWLVKLEGRMFRHVLLVFDSPMNKDPLCA
jgi:hypothetical protein